MKLRNFNPKLATFHTYSVEQNNPKSGYIVGSRGVLQLGGLVTVGPTKYKANKYF